jgi:hypothetical protein
MTDLSEVLRSLRRELFLQLIFNMLSILIPNQKIQLAILALGTTITSILIITKPRIGISRSRQIKVLLSWIAITGIGYLIIPYLWLWGVNTEVDLITFLILVTILILVVPLIIFGKGQNFSASYVGIFGWIAGAGISWAVNSSNGSLACFLIPLFIVGLVSGLWVGSNIVAGVVYTYMSMNLLATSGIYSVLSVIVASASSALITGLAFVVNFVDDN